MASITTSHLYNTEVNLFNTTTPYADEVLNSTTGKPSSEQSSVNLDLSGEFHGWIQYSLVINTLVSFGSK